MTYQGALHNGLRDPGRTPENPQGFRHMAGQSDAEAHCKTHRAPIGGRLRLWVLLRFRLTLAGRALRSNALFSELALRSELILGNPAI